MGFNTTILVLNDALDVLENDTEAGKKIVAGIRAMSSGDHEPITVPIGYHCNPVLIIETHHADLTSIVSVGGNYAHQEALVLGYRFKDKLDRLKAISREIRNEIKRLEQEKKEKLNS